MPIRSISFAPGVNTQITATQGQAQITQSQLIRFKVSGNQVLPEKLGGWQKYYGVSMGSVCRALHAWEGISSDIHLGAGCESSLQVLASGMSQDITPRTGTTDGTVSFNTTASSATVAIDDANFSPSQYDSIFIVTPVSIGGIVLSGSYQIDSIVSSTKYNIIASSAATSTVAAGGAVPVFDTTSGLSIVTVTLNDHGLSVGNPFMVGVSTSVGGVTIYGSYVVQTVPTANTFTINVANEATSTATASENAGDAEIIYYVALAPVPVGGAYGSGGYGSGGYGTGLSGSSYDTGTQITATNWTLDNWGEILMACPANGPIFTWSPDSGFENAVKIVGAPVACGGIFISQPAQILVAWGASTQSVQDPLLIRWSSAADYTDWVASSRTQAGSFRVPTGSKIVGGANGPNFNVIWTDLDVWSMDYIEPPLIFGFNAIAGNCGLIGRHAHGVMLSTVVWMGQGNFYRMDGEQVSIIPCTVWDVVFQDLDQDNADKITCGTNTIFGEVTWFYPSLSGGTGEVDKYVKWNMLANCWDYGTLSRSAWIDQSVIGEPIGAGTANNYLFQHETAADADGQPMDSWFESGYFELSEGEEISFVDWFLPDFKYGKSGASSDAIMSISFKIAQFPNSTAQTIGPYSISSISEYINTGFRARLVAIRVESQDLGSFWRLGGIKARIAPDGRN